MSIQKIKFRKTGNYTYEKELRGYTGTITIKATNPNKGSTTLVIEPGTVTTTWATLGLAKNEFRRFLLDK